MNVRDSGNKKSVFYRGKETQSLSDATKVRRKTLGRNTIFDNKDNEGFTTFQLKKGESEGSNDLDTMLIFPRNWPEWSDDELNAEEWKAENLNADLYHDPEGILLPYSLNGKIESWKRPKEVFQNPIILYDDTVDNIDIISNNRHLLISRYMRWIISSIATVQAIGDDTVFPIEGEHSQYTPNGGSPWRPWHHIYSLCKTGKNPHKPQFNPSGKYIIRLYYLGCWRKILVDDKLPFDSKGRMLLPASTITGELWPMILTKGLLKIALHTWNQKEELNGFQPISCLTGWISEEILNIEFDKLKLWKLIKRLIEEKVEIIEETPQVENAKNKKDGEKSPKGDKKSKKEDKKSKKEDKTSNKEDKASKKEEKKINKEAKSSKRKGKEKPVPKPIKKPKRTDMVGILSFWNEHYNSNEIVEQILPSSNKEKIPSPKGILSCEPMKMLNFPVLFHKYKEIDRVSENQEDIPKCFIKIYSHIFDMKEEPPKDAGKKIEEVIVEEPISPKKKGKKEKKPPAANKSKKEKAGAKTKKAPNMQNIMADTGKWLAYSSLTKLLEGIVLIHKPSMFEAHVQKPDFNKLLSPNLSPQVIENIDKIEEESDLESELGNEEEFYIFLDSPEDIELIFSINVLPTPTKLDDNYGRTFDLMLNACEGQDEEYINYQPIYALCDTFPNVSKEGTVTVKTDISCDLEYSEDMIGLYDEYEYELTNSNENYILKDFLFYERSAEISETFEEEENDEEGEAWSVEEYLVQTYDIKDIITKKCEDEYPTFKPESLREKISVETCLKEKNSFFNDENISSEKEMILEKYILTKFLLSEKLALNPTQNFKTTKEIEDYSGKSLLSYCPHPIGTAANLVIQTFNWNDSNLGHPSLQYCVLDSNNIHFELPPGRSILRVSLRPASFYVLHLLSNIGFVIFSKDALFTEMKRDCTRITKYERNILLSIENLVKSLSGDNYIKEIQYFNNSFLPNNCVNLQRNEKDLIRKAFQRSIYTILINYLEPGISKEIIKALTVVFCNPYFGKTHSYVHEYALIKEKRCPKLENEMIKCGQPEEKLKRHHEAAAKIQSFFKSIFCRKMWNILKENRSFISTQLNILHNLINSNKDIQIMRMMLKEEPILKIMYDLQKDLDNEVDVYEWSGLSLDVDQQSWIPLVRYSFKWDSIEEIQSTIQLTCPLMHYVTNIIDNDTGNLLPRIKNCSPFLCNKNEKGYTFFAYGINEYQCWSCVPWKISHVLTKGTPPMQILINGKSTDLKKPPQLRSETLHGYYVPNMKNLIFSFLIKVMEPSQMSVCVTMSNKLTVFKLELFMNTDLIIAQEMEGMMVIPSLFLNGPDPEKGEEIAVYYGEVTLLNDWPLSEYQTKFAEMQWIKDTALYIDDPTAYQVFVEESPTFYIPGSSMDFKAKQEEILMENEQAKDNQPARWYLHILLDSPHEVVLEELKRKGEIIKNMKREWEENNPGILQNNKKLFAKHEKSKFRECFRYSKKEPTRFKNKFPLFEESKNSEDNQNLEQSGGILGADSKKLKKAKITETKIEHKSSSESLSESESIPDVASICEDIHKSNKICFESWIDHSCGIDPNDINGLIKLGNFNDLTIKVDSSESDFKHQFKNGKDNESSQIIESYSSEKLTGDSGSEELIKFRESLTSKGNSLALTSQNNVKNDQHKNKGLEESMETILDGNIANDKDITSNNILEENNEINLDVEDESKDDEYFENKFHKHTEKEDEKCRIDHYKCYYEDQSEDRSSSSSHEETNVVTQHLMTVDDWVTIQRKITKKQEQFKKKLIKVFTEVECLFRAPFADHLTKWNLYLMNILKNSKDPFLEVEKLRYNYRQAKKKQNIVRKEQMKVEIKRTKELKSKKKKKGKGKKDKPKKEKDKKKQDKKESKGKKEKLADKKQKSEMDVEEETMDVMGYTTKKQKGKK